MKADGLKKKGDFGFLLLVMTIAAGEFLWSAWPAVAQQEEIISKDGARMVLVPAGEFMMGTSEYDDDQEPVHRIYLNDFYMDKHEVTVGQYAKFLEASNTEEPPAWKLMNRPHNQNRPVGYISWFDADAYCQWAEKRLPTEAEWEKAARGTDGRLYPWGNTPPTQRRANFGKSDWNKHAVFVPVGALEDGKSPYGIYDMAGNVWEWVADWYDEKYYAKSPSVNPKGPEYGEKRSLRGASVIKDSASMGATSRWSYPPTLQRFDLGFRCAKVLSPD